MQSNTLIHMQAACCLKCRAPHVQEVLRLAAASHAEIHIRPPSRVNKSVIVLRGTRGSPQWGWITTAKDLKFYPFLLPTLKYVVCCIFLVFMTAGKYRLIHFIPLNSAGRILLFWTIWRLWFHSPPHEPETSLQPHIKSAELPNGDIYRHYTKEKGFAK